MEVGRILSTGADIAADLAIVADARIRAVVRLVDFVATNGHQLMGYATPQRFLIVEAGLSTADANLALRRASFCVGHDLITDALDERRIGIDELDALMAAAEHMAHAFTEDLYDLLDGAGDIELTAFRQRLQLWRWRRRADIADDDARRAHERRGMTLRHDLMGGCSGTFRAEGADAEIITAALFTTPDPTSSVVDPRSEAQRRIDRLVGILDSYLAGEDDDIAGSVEPTGRRRGPGRTVDVIIDLDSLLGTSNGLDGHRTSDGSVDWDSLRAEFARSGTAPKQALAELMCDASWRRLVLDTKNVLIEYSVATPDISTALRRAIQRRDGHCQFDGCDRHWTWCDVHHIIPRHDGGPTTERNLALLCRYHHRLVHVGGWELERDPDGILVTQLA